MKLPVAVLALVALSSPVAAHPLDIGYLRIDSAAESVTIVLDLEITVAAELAKTASDLADATYRMAPLITDAGPCAWTTATTQLNSHTASLIGTASCPEGARTLRWELPFLAKMPAAFRLLLRAQGTAGDRIAIVDQSAPFIELSSATPELGFQILFLVALLIGGGTSLAATIFSAGVYSFFV